MVFQQVHCRATVASVEDFCGFAAYGVEKMQAGCLPFLFANGVMIKLPTLGGPNGYRSRDQ
jgi:hypothetical protein